nr:PREDICTED: arylsulfatase B-like [Bemisia tabaci]
MSIQLHLLGVGILGLAALSPSSPATQERPKPPHIVIIVADDLGWNDVSFHGSDQIPTPNIDALAYSGVILNQHYGEALCSPSRGALLTGKYPIHTGLQHNLIMEPEPWGLPLSEIIMPQYFKKLGYKTHAIGKWHLGFYKKNYTPTFRGFDTHFGFWNGFQDYYTHHVQASFAPYEGYDLRRNMEVVRMVGNHSTTLFTDEAQRLIERHDKSKPFFLYLSHAAVHSGNYENPLQAPQEYIARFKHIKDPNRRIYAAMVSHLDDSVGRVIEALKENDMLQDSIIVLLSDNGAPSTGLHVNHGNNWPLKGEKGTPWEGALRTIACVWSPYIMKPHRVSTDLVYIGDWLPTLYSAAGGDVSQLGEIDGVDLWNCIRRGAPCSRKHVLQNIDDITGYEALRLGAFKYVSGTTLLGYLDKWDPQPDYSQQTTATSYNATRILKSPISQALLEENFSLPSWQEVSDLRQAATVRCSPNDVIKSTPCRPRKEPCLFDISADPCERFNLYRRNEFREIIDDIEKMLATYRKSAVRPGNKPLDPKANPALHNNTWTNWADFFVDPSKVEQPRNFFRGR